MENNPYAPPIADVETPLEPRGEGEIGPPRAVPARNGLRWIRDGVRLLRRGGLPGLAVLLVGPMLSTALNVAQRVVPGNVALQAVSLALSALQSAMTIPFLTLSMIALREIDRGHRIAARTLWATFRTRVPFLVRAALLYLLVGQAVSVGLLLPQSWLVSSGPGGGLTWPFILFALVGRGLNLLIEGVFVLIPPIAMTRGVGLPQALQWSVTAVVRNFGAFVLSQLGLSLLGLLLTVPLLAVAFLGSEPLSPNPGQSPLFLLLPLLNAPFWAATRYCFYKDVLVRREEPSRVAAPPAPLVPAP